MPVIYENVPNSDFYLLYYLNNMYNKSQCMLRTYANNENIFEANEIVDGLYLGNINSVYDEKKLKELGITHIISVLAGFIPPFPEKFEYLVLDALDSENTDLSLKFEITNDFIENAMENNGKVLINCMAGRSRSATILSAYIIYKFGMDAKNAINSIKNKREIVQPNEQFIKQLNEYYENLYTSN